MLGEIHKQRTLRTMTCLQDTCVGFFLGALGSGVVLVVMWLFFGLFGWVLCRGVP